MLGDRKVEIRVGETFDPVPADKYTVEIIDVNLKMQFNSFKGKEEEILNYHFVILDEKEVPAGKEGEDPTSTRGRLLWKGCSMVINTRSNLGKLVTAVEGKELTDEEAEAFDPDSIIGKQVDVMVDQKAGKDGKIWNNIINFSKVVKKLKKLPAKDRKEITAPIQKTTSAVPAQAPSSPKAFVEGVEKEGEKEEKSLAELEADKAELDAKVLRAKANAEIAKNK